ncbi:MAG: NAD(+) synthase [Clostridiales bacterium]|nr:NAD(+) synthase [Clostridiales bacterium]
MRDGFIKVAAATPSIRVADCAHNAAQTIALMREAAAQGVQVLAFPELGLTGYTCADLFLQPTLLKGAEQALAQVVEASRGLEMFVAVSLPLRRNNKLYSCAAAICNGELLGVVPKTHIPNYTEFYEARWFTSGRDYSGVVSLCGQEVQMGTGMVFRCEELPELCIGIELCEDLWVPTPPSNDLAAAGATIILNLSASDEIVCKDAYRRNLVTGQSGRLVCGYVYAGAGEGESSTDLVYGGHDLVAENGSLLAERRFETGLTVSEIDVHKLAFERQRMSTFPVDSENCTDEFRFSLPLRETKLTRYVAPNPFVPADLGDRAARCQEIFTLVSLGLRKRLEHTHAKTAVIGLSGGLDSTLALLITDNAMKLLGRPATDIICVTMPCFGTTDRTRDNATTLAHCLGTTFRRVDIGESVMRHFADIGHDPADRSVTYENCQARERTQVLMDIANKTGGLVIGTGDLSEMALGWSTYNGDHMSMYAVNCSIPKTLVRHLTRYVSDVNRQEKPELSAVLDDILDTPVSPELLPPEENGQIAQKTEDLVGPYELHDFYLYYGIRFGFPPKKVYRLARYAFQGAYSDETILKWEKNFYHRFFMQQFKRSCIPDGPKVGSVTLSPRGDWRMPSDAVADLWKKELDDLQE